jgi:RNA polymerase sigma factor (sigma-70 family)
VVKARARAMAVSREKFTPSENDRKLTVEDYKKFIASKDYVQLERFIQACCSKLSLSEVTADIIFSKTLDAIEKAIGKGQVYESKIEGLRRTIAYRLIGREHKEVNGHASRRKADAQREITARPTPEKFEIEDLPERRRASPEDIACLKDAIAKLSSREQLLFLMDSERVKDREIAATLEISEGNVRQTRYRAIRRLKK